MSEIKRVFKRWGTIGGIRTLISVAFSKLPGFSKKRADENYKLRKAENYGFTITSHKGEWQLKNAELNFFCRKFSSDLDVVKQIFVDDEFGELISLIKKNGVKVKNIIDAGSNIGLSSLRFGMLFPGAKIFSLEPDKENFNLLARNAAANSFQITPLKLGLWKDSRRLYFNRDFRDGKAWSVSLTETPAGDEYIDSISLGELKTKYALEQIDLLKVDIEGGEKMVFGKGSNLDFLNSTRLVAVEIHDEFDCREEIMQALQKNNFIIDQSGEYAIGMNRSFVEAPINK